MDDLWRSIVKGGDLMRSPTSRSMVSMLSYFSERCFSLVIDSEEDEPSKLSQLRTNKSPLLMTYLHKIDPANHPAANCPLCHDPNHDSLHLFNCPDIPTTLTVWDLWTDPVGVAALLDVWGEKLGGPRAGV